MDDEESSRPVFSVREMVRLNRHTLLVGGPGAGKSSLLLRMMGETAAWYLADPEDVPKEPPYGRIIPVRIPATALLGHRQWEIMIADSLNAEMGDFLGGEIPHEMFTGNPSPGLEWLLLVDGLDEVMDPELRQNLIQSISYFISGFGHWRFLIASRNLLQREFAGLQAEGVEVGTTLRFDAYELRPFDADGLAAFAANWFRVRDAANAQERTAAFLEQIERSQLSYLVRVPLLATIAAIVYENDPKDPLPVDRTGLYERFVRGLLYERPARKHVRRRLREIFGRQGPAAEKVAELLVEETERCLEDVAAVRLDRDDAPDAVELGLAWLQTRTEKLPVIPHLVDHIRWVLLSTGLLVAVWDRLDFVHRGFAEYLAAGRAVRLGFAPSEWLRRIRRRGPDNESMFALVRWAHDGNDPVPVLVRLLSPGLTFRFPMLLTYCAVIEDGLPITAEETRRLSSFAVWALRLGRLDEETIAASLLSLTTRTPGASALSVVAYDRLSAPRKRLVAPRLLAERATSPDERTKVMLLLARLGNARLVPRRRRYAALQILARAGTDDLKGQGVAGLAHVIESADDLAACWHVAGLLLELDQAPAAHLALLRRAARAYRWPDRVAAIDLLVELQPRLLPLGVEVSAQQLRDVPAHLVPNLVGKRAEPDASTWSYSVVRSRQRRSMGQPLLTPVDGAAGGTARGSFAERIFAARSLGRLDDLPAEARVAALAAGQPGSVLEPGPATVTTLLSWACSAEQPERLRAAALSALPRLGARGPGAMAAVLILADPDTSARFAIEVCLVFARVYGVESVADLLGDLGQEPGPARRLRVVTRIARLVLVLDRLRTIAGEPGPERAEDRFAINDFDWAALPATAAGDLADEKADNDAASIEVPRLAGEKQPARWRMHVAGRATRRALRVASGDAVNVAIALLIAYAGTGAVGMARLHYGRELAEAAVAQGITTMQARLAVPLFAVLLALLIRPREPDRSVPAAGLVSLAAGGFGAVVIWHDADPSWLPKPPAIAEPLEAANAWLGAWLSAHAIPASMTTLVLALVALMLSSMLTARAERTPAPNHRLPWTALRIAILLSAAVWIAHAAIPYGR